MKVNIDDSTVQGNIHGTKLFIIQIIDEDDTEDSSVELWRANDENDLHDQVKEFYVDEPDEDAEEGEEEPMSILFEDDWGFKILFKEIGTIE